jgi:hypothetical protein
MYIRYLRFADFVVQAVEHVLRELIKLQPTLRFTLVGIPTNKNTSNEGGSTFSLASSLSQPALSQTQAQPLSQSCPRLSTGDAGANATGGGSGGSSGSAGAGANLSLSKLFSTSGGDGRSTNNNIISNHEEMHDDDIGSIIPVHVIQMPEYACNSDASKGSHSHIRKKPSKVVSKRVGAFEVQLATCVFTRMHRITSHGNDDDDNGRTSTKPGDEDCKPTVPVLKVEVVHSKLASRRWPSSNFKNILFDRIKERLS